eukprot:GEMP01009627.1.p1 GENE.GEMP01009627.1~~GEMP01009627.1.p1  ORF type:complete len:684 (+),score=97.44 GEMP01009627.1:202-2253(+)
MALVSNTERRHRGWRLQEMDEALCLEAVDCNWCRKLVAFQRPERHLWLRQSTPHRGLRPIFEDRREDVELLCHECVDKLRAAYVISRWYRNICDRKYAAITIQRYARGWLARRKNSWRDFQRRLASRLRALTMGLTIRDSIERCYRRNCRALAFVFCFTCSRCSFGILLFPKAFTLLGNNIFSVVILTLLGTFVEDRLFRALYHHALTNKFHSIAEALRNASGGRRWLQILLQLTYWTNCIVISCAMYANMCLIIIWGVDGIPFSTQFPENDSLRWLLGLLIFLPFLLIKSSERIIQTTAEKLTAVFSLLAFLSLGIYICLMPSWSLSAFFSLYAPMKWSLCAWSKGASLLFVVFLQDTLDAPLAAVALSTTSKEMYGGTLSAAVWIASVVNFLTGFFFTFTVVIRNDILDIAQATWLLSLFISLYLNLRRAQYHLHGIATQINRLWQHSVAARHGGSALTEGFLPTPPEKMPTQLAAPSSHDLVSWRVLWAFCGPQPKKRVGSNSADDNSPRSSESSFNVAVPRAYRHIQRSQSSSSPLLASLFYGRQGSVPPCSPSYDVSASSGYVTPPWNDPSTSTSFLQRPSLRGVATRQHRHSLRHIISNSSVDRQIGRLRGTFLDRLLRCRAGLAHGVPRLRRLRHIACCELAKHVEHDGFRAWRAVDRHATCRRDAYPVAETAQRG